MTYSNDTQSASPKPYVAPNREGAGLDKRRSALHDGIKITGDWTSDGIVDFGGTLTGDFTAQTLVLTKTGHISGNVHAETVTLEGSVEGKVVATTLIIKTSARVTADIVAHNITVEVGAHLEGRVSMAAQASNP